MPYVKPSGQIHIFNCPLTPDYAHTFWFETSQSQANHMYSAYGGKYLTEQLYTRTTVGMMRVSVPIAEMLEYNYLQWRDTEHGNKWYYAFITSYEYLAEGTTEIRFELDLIQTYMFDWELKTCFIARQHAETDEIGDNIQPEPVETGEMLPEAPKILFDGDTILAVSVGAQPENSTYNEYDARVYDNVPTGSTIRLYNLYDSVGIRNFLREVPDDQWKNKLVQSINGLYAIPRAIIPLSSIPSGGINLDSGTGADTDKISIAKPDGTESFGGYQPKNKKLYTYPYYYVEVSANNGHTMPLRYEFWQSETCDFIFYGTLLRPVSVICRPVNYGAYSTVEALQDIESVVEGIELSQFPLGQWNTGGYAEWVAQNSIPQIVNTFSGVIGNAVSGNFAGAVGTVVNTMMQDYRASYEASTTRGNAYGGGANAAHNVQNIYASRMRCHSQRARSIDNFFTMFGYAQNKIGVPNIHARTSYTYVRTHNMCMAGNIPADAKRRIVQAFNDGVTFWATPQDIMNYSADNAPLGNTAREVDEFNEYDTREA